MFAQLAPVSWRRSVGAVVGAGQLAPVSWRQSRRRLPCYIIPHTPLMLDETMSTRPPTQVPGERLRYVCEVGLTQIEVSMKRKLSERRKGSLVDQETTSLLPQILFPCTHNTAFLVGAITTSRARRCERWLQQQRLVGWCSCECARGCWGRPCPQAGTT